ncbi:MAG TPA: YbaY family lipoprotein [Opitutaceae bacterium]|jgi:uncharacterized lipoprotein YbaY
MRRPGALLLAACALALSGCGQLDLTPEGDPSRVVQGEVNLGDTALPPDAVVTVRVVDPSQTPPLTLGSQTIRSPGASPVPFKVDFRAEDDLLRRGLNIEARVSIGGHLRFYNVDRYVVTLGNITGTQRIRVNPTGP